ncbi:hypothetical protein QJS10_CPA10g00825 [Acorus calamus]|uniref:Uncharacterized protein n=1 Tax=Acorus calamus TaxID=4465 RepID=A0AAV9E1D9_ACOCL|nr:hypothetical protein QJS10_CPA10g00825 [Acorus calamus]
MSSLTIGEVISIDRASPSTSTSTSKRRSKISCVGWDPEGILGLPAGGGHIARLEFKKRLEKDADAREAFERQLKEEQERRRAQREASFPFQFGGIDACVVPETAEGLVEYFLDTDAQELEISRLRPRWYEKIRTLIKPADVSIDSYWLGLFAKLFKDLIFNVESGGGAAPVAVAAPAAGGGGVAPVFEEKKLLEMVEHNELNRSLLSLLDENITSALDADQKEVADFMESVHASILKYLTV